MDTIKQSTANSNNKKFADSHSQSPQVNAHTCDLITASDDCDVMTDRCEQDVKKYSPGGAKGIDGIKQRVRIWVVHADTLGSLGWLVLLAACIVLIYEHSPV